ncbi:MAG: hypothetical protein M5U01_12060 [Ardenticatenaceae bacterium]|nr:hypothetical protein [Ardenticatenaceae bacterium]
MPFDPRQAGPRAAVRGVEFKNLFERLTSLRRLLHTGKPEPGGRVVGGNVRRRLQVTPRELLLASLGGGLTLADQGFGAFSKWRGLHVYRSSQSCGYDTTVQPAHASNSAVHRAYSRSSLQGADWSNEAI